MDRIHAKRKVVFFNNLVLLGLNPVTFEEKYGIPFHKDMFDLPNKKGFEIVTYFLFSKLSAVTEKDYNLPWPVLNKELGRNFQKTCYSHLANFAQENEVRFPRIVPSILATFGGIRFYELYFTFSSYVLKRTVRKNANVNIISRPSVTPENFTIVNRIIQLSTITSKEKFIDIETATHINDLIWTKYAKNLSECLQKLKQMEKTNKELLRVKTNLLVNIYCTVPDEDLKVENFVDECLTNLKLVNKERQILDQFFSSEETLWQHLASEVGENVDEEVLNGQDIDIGIIDNLPDTFNIELKKVGFSSSRKDGKMSVVRFLKLLRAYLRSLTELIKTKNINDLCETDMSVLSTEQDLLSINSLNEKLSEKIIPDLEESMKKLKLRYPFEDSEDFFESPLNQISSLPVLSYDSEAVKKRLMGVDPNLEENLHLYSSEDVCSYLDLTHISATNLFEVNTSMNATLSNKSPPSTCKQKLGSARKVFAETSNSSKNNILLDSIPSRFDFSALNDIDFDPPVHFKMRGSWLQEDILNDMTLPNTSFDD